MDFEFISNNNHSSTEPSIYNRYGSGMVKQHERDTMVTYFVAKSDEEFKLLEEWNSDGVLVSDGRRLKTIGFTTHDEEQFEVLLTEPVFSVSSIVTGHSGFKSLKILSSVLKFWKGMASSQSKSSFESLMVRASSLEKKKLEFTTPNVKEYRSPQGLGDSWIPAETKLLCDLMIKTHNLRKTNALALKNQSKLRNLSADEKALIIVEPDDEIEIINRCFKGDKPTDMFFYSRDYRFPFLKSPEYSCAHFLLNILSCKSHLEKHKPFSYGGQNTGWIGGASTDIDYGRKITRILEASNSFQYWEDVIFEKASHGNMEWREWKERLLDFNTNRGAEYTYIDSKGKVYWTSVYQGYTNMVKKWHPLDWFPGSRRNCPYNCIEFLRNLLNHYFSIHMQVNQGKGKGKGKSIPKKYIHNYITKYTPGGIIRKIERIFPGLLKAYLVFLVEEKNLIINLKKH